MMYVFKQKTVIESCEDCPICRREWEGTAEGINDYACNILHRELSENEVENERPKDCPLMRTGICSAIPRQEEAQE